MDLLATSVRSWTAVIWERNTPECTQSLKDERTWNQIPCLNGAASHHFVDGQLVRFRGMIQDMHNPEFYMESYEVHNSVTGITQKKSGKFKDIVICELEEEIKFDSSGNNNGERQSFYCVSVPAVNQWALESHAEENSESFSAYEVDSKERRGQKRGVEESMEVEEEETHENSQKSKKQGEKSESQQVAASSAADLNLPLPESVGQACILKVYDADEKVLLNAEVEVCGFLSLDPKLSCLAAEEEDNMMEEQRTLHLPPSLVPRLHVIALHHIKHSVPLLPKFNFDSELSSVLREGAAALQDLRIVLTPVLLGDQLASDFLICHLISRVFLRKDVTTLGHLSINFFNIPTDQDYAVKVYSILQQLLPKTHYLPLTLNNLNTISFAPKKDYKSDQLRSGLLQLTDGTLLVLDETKLSTGQLGDLGTRNMLALQTLIAKQKVDYDFQFYQMEFPADIPVLIFSEKKSLLPSDIPFPLESDADSLHLLEQTFEAANIFLKNEIVLNRIRTFLCAARLAEYNIPDPVQEMVQEDFVEMRQQNQKIKGEDLHSMLVLARLLTLSKGEQNLSVDLWRQARLMEEARRERLGC